MSALSLLSALSRFSLQSVFAVKSQTRGVQTSVPLLFRITPCLLAEPLKKKKRLDPAIIKAREDRRKKKIEKQIRRLEKCARQLKPIEECEVPLTLLDQRKQRQRPLQILNHEVQEERALLQKKWADYKQNQHLADIKMLDNIMLSQQKALDELRKISEELYLEAIQIDTMLLPFQMQGPVITPCIDNCDSPEGDYQDVSKKWN